MLKVARRFAVLVVFVFLAAPVNAGVITGQVWDDVTEEPLEGARVRVQASAGEPVLTDEKGEFVLPVEPGATEVVTAVVSYDSTREVNYIVGGLSASDGQNITIRLTPLAEEDRENYHPLDPGTCGSCHQHQYNEWLDSNHSHAAQNEWVLDLFAEFRDTHDEDDTGFCATCHAPLEDVLGEGVFLDKVSKSSPSVDCLACHLMAEVNDNFSALHHEGNTQYYFPGTPMANFGVWGPLDDVIQTMNASHQPQFSQAEFCASCHQYNNPNQPDVPGQTTYAEWLASPFGPEGEESKVCQDCHMPPASVPGPIVVTGGPIRPAEQRRNHTFTGATPITLTDAIDLDIAANQDGARLVVHAEVANHGAGHFFPTGISIRNAILHIEARHDGVPLAQTSGPVVPFYGSADEGNDPQKDLAGRPGKGFARVLEGRINGQGPTVYPVLFIDAENVREETRIPSGESDHSAYRFDLSGVPEGATVEISARLLYRRAWRNLEVRMGWTETPAGGDIEILVASESLEWTAQAILDPVFSDRFESAGEP